MRFIAEAMEGQRVGLGLRVGGEPPRGGVSEKCQFCVGFALGCGDSERMSMRGGAAAPAPLTLQNGTSNLFALFRMLFVLHGSGYLTRGAARRS